MGVHCSLFALMRTKPLSHGTDTMTGRIDRKMFEISGIYRIRVIDDACDVMHIPRVCGIVMVEMIGGLWRLVETGGGWVGLTRGRIRRLPHTRSLSETSQRLAATADSATLAGTVASATTLNAGTS